MTTLPAISPPSDRNRVNTGVLSYMRERHRGNVYDLVLNEFEKSGLTQAVIADRLGKAPEVISRWLGAPGNWTLDTVSDLLFSMSGAEPSYSIHYLYGTQDAGNYEIEPQQQGIVLDAAPYTIEGNVVYTIFDIMPRVYKMLY